VSVMQPTASALSLQAYFDRFLPPIEAEMQAIVKASSPRHRNFFDMMRYHLGWADAEFNPCEARSGKRVRPVEL
jgi:hypothetical protein